MEKKCHRTAVFTCPAAQLQAAVQWCDVWWWLRWSAPAAHSAAAGAQTPQRTPGTLQEPLHTGAGTAGIDHNHRESPY